MITGSAESHSTAGDSRTNADGLSFPPWTMAVTLRMGGKNELALKALSYARLLCFLALQWEHIHLWVCVPVWNNVADSKKWAREDSLRSRNRGSPSTLPFLTSSLILPLFIFSRSTSLLRQTLVPFPFIMHSFISSALIRLYSKARHLQSPLGTALRDEEKQNATRLINISGRRLRNRCYVKTRADSSSFIR